MVACAKEVASGSLSLPVRDPEGVYAMLPAGCVGAFVGLTGARNQTQLGVIASLDDCTYMARKLLMCEPDEVLSPSDVRDSVGEIVNIVVGMMKTRLIDRDPQLALGLPMFVSGRVARSDAAEYRVATLPVGTAKAHLVVIRRR